MSLRLWGNRASRAFMVHWALHELGLPYEKRLVGSRTGETQTDEFLRMHPAGKIPVLEDGEFVVQAGSQARSREGVSEVSSYAHLFDELTRAGVLKPTGGNYVFVENYAFRSPSAAATVVLGFSANGTIVWKTPDGQTYKDWEAAQLAG